MIHFRTLNHLEFCHLANTKCYGAHLVECSLFTKQLAFDCSMDSEKNPCCNRMQVILILLELIVVICICNEDWRIYLG